MSKGLKNKWVLVLLLLGFLNPNYADIKIVFNPDTSKWAPVAYLSIIPEFGQMHTISYESIIAEAHWQQPGYFIFETNRFDAKVQLYRIHFVKKGDPPTSLIIGGKDQNHLFFLARNDDNFILRIRSGKAFLDKIECKNSIPNQSIAYINSLTRMIDSLDQYGSSFNRQFLRNAVYKEILNYSDTSTIAHAALYGIYQTDFKSDFKQHPDYYYTFLEKWESEESQYFVSFKKELDLNDSTGNYRLLYFMALVVLLLAVIGLLIFRKGKKRNPQSQLTIQERKIVSSLKEGKSNKEIAEEFSISISTVKTHINNIYSKLGINSRKQIMDIEE